MKTSLALLLTAGILSSCSPSASPYANEELTLADIDDPTRGSARTPGFATSVPFIDAHMHCDEVTTDKSSCLVEGAWRDLAGQGGRGVIASLEHWNVGMNDETRAALLRERPDAPDFSELNEIYLKTARSRPDVEFLASLECWHDTPFGPDWADACKEDARRWVQAGAIGFKDHIGKQWDGADDPVAADAGVFAGAWTRRSGACAQATTNRACALTDEVRYPALEPAWREVLRYLTEDLHAPVLTHATTFYGASARCHDPLTNADANCAEMSRQHLLELALWAKANLSEDARKRIVVAHTGFMIPGGSTSTEDARRMLAQLGEVLDAGLSVDTAATKDFAYTILNDDPETGVCALRALIGDHPEQFVFGTDRLLDNGSCIQGTYTFWEDMLARKPNDPGPEHTTCLGKASTAGLALGTPTIDACPDAPVPAGTLERVASKNLLSLYPAQP